MGAKIKRIVNQTGKKKTAIARVTVKEGKGFIRINKKPLEIIEPEVVKAKISEPLFIASQDPDININGIDAEVNVKGGGVMGQAEATRTAIARGLVEWTKSEKLRESYLKYDRSLLVSDSRQKEKKKFGGRGARARRQKSYR
jgi:small subunit ribosomal protein S9